MSKIVVDFDGPEGVGDMTADIFFSFEPLRLLVQRQEQLDGRWMRFFVAEYLEQRLRHVSYRAKNCARG